MNNNNDKPIQNLPKLYNGELAPAYNPQDFIKPTPNMEDLANYANLNYANFFTNNNYFQMISVLSINNISSTALGYLVNITQDVQGALDYLSGSVSGILTTISNFSYDSVNNITSLSGFSYFNSLSSPNNLAVSGDAGISGNLYVNSINTTTIQTSRMNTQYITSSSITTNSIIFNNDVGCYLYINVLIPTSGQTYTNSILPIPLMKSQTASNLFNISNPFVCSITLKNNYSIQFLDSNGYVLYSLTNYTNDFLYNKNVSFTGNLYQINLFLNNNLLN